MDVRADDSDLKKLLIYNRALPNADVYARIEQLERAWIEPLVRELERTTPKVASREEWIDALDGLLEAEAKGTESSFFLADEASRDQFRLYVKEFALDGLTEAQNFFPVIARLPIKAQMAMMRILIDEFGCGNLRQAHSQLYRNLLAELDLPEDLESYLDDTSDETYVFLNSFYWLAARAPDVAYFLGALAYLEASIPGAFSFLARGCERLGIENGRYYTEHVHIDNFHMKEMQTAIREYEAVRVLDATKLWIGAHLMSDVLKTATDSAVDKARTRA